MTFVGTVKLVAGIFLSLAALERNCGWQGLSILGYSTLVLLNLRGVLEGAGECRNLVCFEGVADFEGTLPELGRRLMSESALGLLLIEIVRCRLISEFALGLLLTEIILRRLLSEFALGRLLIDVVLRPLMSVFALGLLFAFGLLLSEILRRRVISEFALGLPFVLRDLPPERVRRTLTCKSVQLLKAGPGAES